MSYEFTKVIEIKKEVFDVGIIITIVQHMFRYTPSLDSITKN